MKYEHEKSRLQAQTAKIREEAQLGEVHFCDSCRRGSKGAECWFVILMNNLGGESEMESLFF